MNNSMRLRSTLAAALVCLPLLAVAQAPSPPASGPAATSSQQTPTAPRTREEVSREVREAMRDAASWRCLTNNRGWCSTPPSALRASANKGAAS